MNVSEADIARDGDFYRISVKSYSPTLGWKDVSLEAVTYIDQPADGIQDLVLSGTPPRGMFQLPTIQIYDLDVTLSAKEAPWFKGIRIRNSSGETLRTLRTGVLNQEAVGKDWVAVNAAALQGDKVVLECKYGGGCHQNHNFQLSWDGRTRESFPEQVVLDLSHDNNGDTCRAIVSEIIQFDISPIIDNPQDYVIFINSQGAEIQAYYPSQE